ncbi:MAG: hypothetical protein N4A49_09295 [Marinifilaceae bacterium]|jgi:hypothetical protein|nr:hypothetical protein [Marinifilaceae bacterium]
MNKDELRTFLVNEVAFREYIRNNDDLSPDFIENYFNHIRKSSDIAREGIEEFSSIVVNLNNGGTIELKASCEECSSFSPFFVQEKSLKNVIKDCDILISSNSETE